MHGFAAVSLELARCPVRRFGGRGQPLLLWLSRPHAGALRGRDPWRDDGRRRGPLLLRRLPLRAAWHRGWRPGGRGTGQRRGHDLRRRHRLGCNGHGVAAPSALHGDVGLAGCRPLRPGFGCGLRHGAGGAACERPAAGGGAGRRPARRGRGRGALLHVDGIHAGGVERAARRQLLGRRLRLPRGRPGDRCVHPARHLRHHPGPRRVRPVHLPPPQGPGRGGRRASAGAAVLVAGVPRDGHEERPPRLACAERDPGLTAVPCVCTSCPALAARPPCPTSVHS
mmetsp:Transcript_36700/g.114223  ORF Transcript_36700/g.114223 Transcript_36700/m.114223 type:complete len:282 (+) Transcript_36700:837-1682(+)